MILSRSSLGATLLAVALLFPACSDSGHVQKTPFDISSPASSSGTALYTTDEAQIAEHYSFPEWIRDGKFGIFIHWGPYAVPAFESEWYPNLMYKQGSASFAHHREVWGDQREFGYKDFIPMFTGERFDAREWIALFQRAGARYVVPVGEHHDGFAMYDSDVNPWNSVNDGPHRDILWEIKQAAEEAGMVFGISNHRGENYYFFGGGTQFPSDVADPAAVRTNKYGEPVSLYGELRANRNVAPSEQFLRDWLIQLYEMVDWYHPQLMYFDGTPGDAFFRPYFKQFVAHYYNEALDWGKEVAVNYKIGFPSDIAMYDVERGKLGGIRRNPWQSDTSVGLKSWGYLTDEDYKTPRQLVHDMVDVVSRNGAFLLNVGPRPDGTVPDEVAGILSGIGRWLDVNGEAVYGTRCWVRFGEGPTLGGLKDNLAADYTTQDFRFTAKGRTLYAILMSWSGEPVLIRSLDAAHAPGLKVSGVSLLGSDESLRWELTDEGLAVTLPPTPPCEYAYALRIDLEGVVTGDTEPYFVERDSNPPRTADTYVYNHTGESVTVTVLDRTLTVPPASSARIQSDIR